MRQAITSRSTFNFLNWNLFLAALPWLISMFAVSQFINKKPKIFFVILLFLWFLLLPNAFYIITDLIYLMDHSEYFFWYDLFMILIFSWTGMLFGFFSLERIEDMYARKLSKIKSVLITVVLLFICAFGVYLGRDLRWNSWSVFIDPKNFFLDVLDRFIKPFGHVRTWGFTFLMGTLLNVLYWSIKLIQKGINNHQNLNN
jgi:uncharacterized membrane protein